MLILRMLLRITNLTQAELAELLGVSRASLNSWLSDDSTMSLTSKSNIADFFQFPVSYFDIDLDQDISLYKVIFATLNNSWNRIKLAKEESKSVSIDDKINGILNNLEFDLNDEIEYGDLSDEEIIEGLAGGYNPYTGECFEENHILMVEDVKRILLKLKKTYKELSQIIIKDDLNEEQLELFEKLRKWRWDVSIEEEHATPYLVFSDKDLFNIVCADITKKSDLRQVRGIGPIKYEKYSDDLWEILNPYTHDIEDDPFRSFADFDISLDEDDLPF